MKRTKIVLALVAAALLAAGGYGLFWLGARHGSAAGRPAAGAATPAAAGAATGAVDPATGRKVLYWHDPMVPGQKFDKPGKSPFMDMALVPVYADEAGNGGGIAIDPRVQQNLGIRTAEATLSSLTPTVEAVGSVAYNERDVALVQARSNGFVERLYVRAPLESVRRGQRLADLYVPDWVAAQEEYLAVKQMHGPGTDGLVDAARQRMRLVGMTQDQIRQVESAGRVSPRMSLVSPVSGVVAELTAREGMTVSAGAPLFRINGLDTIWVNAEVPESAAAQIRPGSPVQARAPSYPGEVFKGKVGAILPEVSTATRTLKARIELANPGNRLVPGMFATVNFTPAAGSAVLTVPSEAVIQTGQRSVVMLAESGGKFTPVEVQTGTEAGGKTEIRKGLEAGQKVVVSGQFLVDSEASLKGAAARMIGAQGTGTADRPGAAQQGPMVHHGQGKVEQITKEDITLSHGPIPTMKWPAMTMGFQLPAGGLPPAVKVGDTVSFAFEQTADGEVRITSIAPAPAGQNAVSK
jgi:Cu(I)/Ag(I) efflux system membrane fusion protein